jgi:glyceraldehyde 3-phosphate dehydrogenase
MNAMPTRIAINGLGRIGRCVLRAAHMRGADLEFVAVNDLADASELVRLLARDSVYGRFPGRVELRDDGIAVGDHHIAAFAEHDPADLPWRQLAVDVVLECTGRFRRREDVERHLDAGADKVVLSAPGKGERAADVDVVLGVNFEDVYDPEKHRIITNASCTTNCLAPVAKVLHEAIGIRHGQMTTVHAYTADQNLLDGPHTDPRRARAAAINLVPTSTGAAKAIGLVIPELAGRLHGLAVRAPVPTGSLVDLTFESERPTSTAEVNDAVRSRADTGRLAGILEFSEDPLVSSDVVGSPYSAIFAAHQRRRRHAGQGRRLVRQRVGLREPAGGAGRARAGAADQPAACRPCLMTPRESDHDGPTRGSFLLDPSDEIDQLVFEPR